MNVESIVWIVLFVIFLVIEGTTLNLLTIWFALGALVAFILSLFHLNLFVQIVVFLLVSIAMLFLIFPIAKKKLRVGTAKTNVDSLIGKEVFVTKPIFPHQDGEVSINDILWTAASEKAFNQGDLVRILKIEGNRIIVTSPDHTIGGE